jgi:hypothetical protein
MNMRKCVWLLVPLAVLTGACKKGGDDDTGASAAPAPPPPTTAAATTSQAIKVEQPPAKPGIEARVRAELDNRADGIAGTPMAASGAKATVPAPAGWAGSKAGNFAVSTAANKKSQLAAAGATGETPDGAATALGLTGCQWGSPESITVGKDKLAATAADGVCQRGAASVKTAQVTLSNENLLVVGAWDPDGDSANVFGAMRAIAKAGTGGGDALGIAACCSALAQNQKSAPPEQQGIYAIGVADCAAVRNSPEGRAALAQVRGALRGVAIPAACQ